MAQQDWWVQPLSKTEEDVVTPIKDKIDSNNSTIRKGVLIEQAAVAVDVTAESASETNVLELSEADTMYVVRNMRLKAADPGTDTITVTLYENVNDSLTAVETFSITTDNFGTYHTIDSMFSHPQLVGNSLKVTVQTDANSYAVTGQYNYAQADMG